MGCSSSSSGFKILLPIGFPRTLPPRPIGIQSGIPPIAGIFRVGGNVRSNGGIVKIADGRPPTARKVWCAGQGAVEGRVAGFTNRILLFNGGHKHTTIYDCGGADRVGVDP